MLFRVLVDGKKTMQGKGRQTQKLLAKRVAGIIRSSKYLNKFIYSSDSLKIIHFRLFLARVNNFG